MPALIVLSLVVTINFGFSQQQNFIPLQLESVVAEGINGSCPSAATRETIHQSIQEEVRSLLSDILFQPSCACGSSGRWTRIAHLNMSDLSQQCPQNWDLTFTPVRACGRSNPIGPSCDSAFFASNGQTYSHVCGRVNGYQVASTDAFDPSIEGFGIEAVFNATLEAPYIDGVSLTHGAEGSRQHIWSFVSALYETEIPTTALIAICSCTNTNESWPFQVPPFIGNNYFCATGNTGPGFEFNIVYSDDLLWDGKGCGPTNACCQQNNPSWFCTTLSQPTTNDLELRICLDQNIDDEDVLISNIDMYIM